MEIYILLVDHSTYPNISQYLRKYFEPSGELAGRYTFYTGIERNKKSEYWGCHRYLIKASEKDIERFYEDYNKESATIMRI